MNTIFSLLMCVAPVVGQVEPQAEQGPLLLAHREVSPGGAETMRCTDLNGKLRVKGNPNIYVDFCHE